MLKGIFKASAFIGCLFLCAGKVTAESAERAARIGKYNNWGTYQHQTKNGKMCYILTVPIQKEPKNLDHGNVFFFLSPRSKSHSYYEPQMIAGYAFQDKSKISVTIHGKSFSMKTKDKSASMEEVEKQQELIEEMKNGSLMKVEAISKRGNKTTYLFSLKGISMAISSLAACEAN